MQKFNQTTTLTKNNNNKKVTTKKKRGKTTTTTPCFSTFSSPGKKHPTTTKSKNKVITILSFPNENHSSRQGLWPIHLSIGT